MRKSLLTKVAMIAMVVAILVTGCQPAATSAPSAAPATEAGATEPATQAPATSAEQPYFAFVTAPVGVNEFTKLGVTGLEVSGEKWNARTKLMETSASDPTASEEAIQDAVADNATIVIVFGYEYNDMITRIAPTAPDTQFLIVDQCIDNPPANVHCATSLEYQAAFLIGVEAAMLTETNHVGVIGALDIPFLHRYTDAFAQGAQYINPDIIVDIRWVGGDNPFSDPVRAKQQALALASAGADQIFAGAAAGNMGIFEAAQETGFYTYGVDVTTQCALAPGFVVDSLLKHADVEMEKSIDAIMEGTATEPTTVYGLESGGIGTVAQLPGDQSATQCLIAGHPDVIQRVNEVAQQIIDGTIALQDPMFQQ